MVIPIGAYKILRVLNDNGYEAYVVGGCVRDMLLGKEPNDWDICTNAKPAQVAQCFLSYGYRIIETGLKHGTITVIANNIPYEITTYRVDGPYSDGRRPDSVEYVDSLYEDLSRRDFTINAMAYHPIKGLIDYFNGQQDLKNGIISCVGDSDERFKEDALRILRALRFASTLGFRLDSKTAESVHRLRSLLLSSVAYERINKELCKLLMGDAVKDVLLEYSDVIATFIPEIIPCIGFKQNNPYHIYDVWEHTANSVSNAVCNLNVRLALLFHDISKPQCYIPSKDGIGQYPKHPEISKEIANAVMKRLRFDKETISTVSVLIAYHDVDIKAREKNARRWLNKIGYSAFQMLIFVKVADIKAQNRQFASERLKELNKVCTCIEKVVQQQQCFQLKDLAINGNDLIKMGMKEGKEIGKTLRYLLDLVIDGIVENDKERLLEIAEQTLNY